jgi:hypothetical protein
MPSFTSGLGAQLVVAKETTYGTRVVPNRSFQMRQEGLKRNQDFLKSQQLQGGVMFQRSSTRVPTTRSAAGPLTLEVPNKGFGIWLDQLHGATVAPVQQAATTAYKQSHPIGLTDPAGKSMTVQVGRPSTDGTVRPFDYLGTKVLSATFRAAVGEFLVAELSLDAQDEDTSQALAAFAPASGLKSFAFTGGAVTLDGASAGVVKSIEIPITYAYATDRFGLGGALKAAPLTNGYPTIQPKVDVEWKDNTQYDKFRNGAIAALVVDFVGANIASTYFEEIKFTMAACGLDGDTPTVDGPDILTQSIPLDVLYDGTNAPLVIDYTSIDTAL